MPEEAPDNPPLPEKQAEPEMDYDKKDRVAYASVTIAAAIVSNPSSCGAQMSDGEMDRITDLSVALARKIMDRVEKL